MTVRIYGHSDDLVEIDGEFRGENEIGCYERPVRLIVNDFTLCESVVVDVEYDTAGVGVWRVAVQPVDEDKPMPNMKIVMADNGYSPMLWIDCSENTAVSEVAK